MDNFSKYSEKMLFVTYPIRNHQKIGMRYGIFSKYLASNMSTLKNTCFLSVCKQAAHPSGRWWMHLERSSSYEKRSPSNKIYEISFSVVQKVLKLTKGKCKKWAKRKNNTEVYMELQLTKFILIGQLPVWYLEETQRKSDSFQIYTWDSLIIYEHTPKVLSAYPPSLLSYSRFISLGQTQ